MGGDLAVVQFELINKLRMISASPPRIFDHEMHEWALLL